MDEDGHPPELLLHFINTGVRVHLQNLEGVEIPIGVSWLGKSLYLSCWGEVLVSLLYLQYNITIRLEQNTSTKYLSQLTSFSSL